ncbi:hypothetical protein PF005_g2893 [Phytophthora fragariae]|uniref:PDZ domain-containing protein n=3 Tax=Phytophthora fragariae TaxID=53985 RepID=A0A6A3FQ93_9STRA|nr:hypothetical protein PF009_g2139 [Phytophthora fragariae]KAE9134619.1 hypothetical protein PF007_g2872 [Phytophthora fragariae]KAE9231977.1 hypothetical protein PF005_g2893 [Phytophthora fragariae]KAE9326251.1 hypothetical protein PF001_g2523 [Phytophthora fragariae]
MAVDEFGREHYVLEAPAGRLGILLVENDRGFIIVQGFGEIAAAYQATSSTETDKGRLSMMRQVVRSGDRLVAIDGDMVVHCSLSEIIARLGKLSAKKRELKFARYHQAQRASKNYDPEKLTLVRAPSGPLGLILSDVLPYGAVIEGFQQLPDGSESHFKKGQNVHRGCQIVEINGTDVSGLPREEVTNLLAGMREQDKEIVLYRLTSSTCARFSQLVVLREDMGVNFLETENFHCVVATAFGTEVVEGDVLIGIDNTDITSMSRAAAMELLNQTPYPQTLTFYRSETATLPECHSMQIEAGPSGLNLDSSDPSHARITGFTTPEDADRPTCKNLRYFVPGSYIIGINGLDVQQHTLADISRLFSKLRNTSKQIVVGNPALMNLLDQNRSVATINVPPGPLGIIFDGGHDDVACVAGFNPMADGNPGSVEQSGQVPVGSRLQTINKMNVTCLTLNQTVSLLQKLSSAPKELGFLTRIKARDCNPRAVNIRVPPGPLGIDLRTTTSNTVAVDRLNEDPAHGPTHIFNHGGVVSGSEILSIDGFDVSSLEVSELSQLLRLFAPHEKIITFGTTTDAYASMINPALKPALKSLIVSKSPMGIEFDSSLENAACTTNVAKSDSNEEIPVGSRLIAIDNVDIRALSLNEVVGVLKSLAGLQKTLTFDTEHRQITPPPSTTSAPSSPILKKILKGSSAFDASSTVFPQQPTSSSTVNASLTKSTVRFAGLQPSQDTPTPPTNAPQLRPPPLKIDPPSAALSALSIRTVEATKASAQVESSNAKQEPALNSPKTQFMISMSSWSGSRESSRLVVDKFEKCLHIMPLNPSSPSSAKTVVIPFADISTLDTGKASPPPSPSKRGLFRSLSSKKDMTEHYPLIISVVDSSGKKKTKVWEFDMLSSGERDELEAILLH